MGEITVWTIGLFVGFFAIITFLFVVIIAPDRCNKGKKYDERQILARNMAYKSSFIFLLLYCTACAILEIIGIKWAMLTIMLFIGILGSITLFVIVCILKDAYNGLNSKKSPYGFCILTLIYSVWGFEKFLSSIHKGESIFTDGMLNENIIFLLFSILFFAMFITKIINILIKKADED